MCQRKSSVGKPAANKTGSKKPDFPTFSGFVKNRPIPISIPQPYIIVLVQLETHNLAWLILIAK